MNHLSLLSVDSSIINIRVSLAVIVLTQVFLLYSLLAHYRRVNKSTSNYLCPKVPGKLPIIGNSLGGNGTENFNTKLEEWASKYGKETGMCECTLFGMRYVLISNADLAQTMQNQRPYRLTRLLNLNRAVDSTGGLGLFSAEGESWRKDRRIVGPSLNRKNVRDYIAAMKLVSQRLIRKWKHHVEVSGGGAISINEDMQSCAMDIISLVAFAKDIDSVTVVDSVLGCDIRAILAIIGMRALSPFPYWNIPFIGQYLDGGAWPINRVNQICKDVIQEYEDEGDKKAVSVNDHDGEGKDNDARNQVKIFTDSKSKTFLGKMVELSKKDTATMSAERLVGNLLTMFAAGAESSAVTLSTSLYEIAIDGTGLQGELAAEALALKNFEEAKMSLEEIYNGLPRMRSFVYELLRIRGPSASLGLENSSEPIEIGGILHPPHTMFFILSRYISTIEVMSESGSDHPSKSSTKIGTPRGPRDAPLTDFCPRRWLQPNESDGESKHNGNVEISYTVTTPTFKTGYNPFGMGARVCPGREMAEVEILLILSAILRNFEISLEEGHPPVKLVTRFTECPDRDIRLSLKPREI